MTSPRHGGNTALLLLDLQEGIARTRGRAAQHATERSVLARAADTLSAARTTGLPVIHVRVAFTADYSNLTSHAPAFEAMRGDPRLLSSSASAEICSEVSPIDGEPVVTKGGIDPFVGTALLNHLIGRGVTSVAVAGVATNFVVESAARHASDLGFDVLVLEDLCASFSADAHRFAVEEILPHFSRVIDSTEFVDCVTITDAGHESAGA